MKMNKKGFTIVELVIVIAVIAILAGVMIPTFSGVIDNANKTTAKQEASNVYKQIMAMDPSANTDVIYIDVAKGGTTYHFSVTNGEVDEADETAYNAAVDGTPATGEEAAVAPTHTEKPTFTSITDSTVTYTVPDDVTVYVK